jgi:hypothetical protein
LTALRIPAPGRTGENCTIFKANCGGEH